MGLSFTKREIRLQSGILHYKMGFLGYKRDSHVAIHLKFLLLKVYGKKSVKNKITAYKNSMNTYFKAITWNHRKSKVIYNSIAERDAVL